MREAGTVSAVAGFLPLTISESKMATIDITSERLKEILHYEPEAGIFRWKKKSSRKIKVGQIAGTEGPRGICINSKEFGRPMLAHRLAWLYMTGSFPDKGMVIDHRDRNPFNNVFSNLRLCTQRQNTWNQGLKKGNRTGVKGVNLLPSGKFHARIRTLEGIKLLGNFRTIEEAAHAVAGARSEYHGEFASNGGPLSPNRPD